MVLLLESTLIRIGNPRYARSNHSYGLTTLRTRHVDIRGASIHFHFRGKSGVEHKVTLRDRRLARLIRRCMELPGQQLFQYLDEDGQRRSVTSNDVNLYLREMSGCDFTAKDYRTWAGSALALEYLRRLEHLPETLARQNLVETVKQVASQLGNTPAVCRQCYIHPAILQAFNEGALTSLRAARKRKWLSAEEAALLRFLQNRVQHRPAELELCRAESGWSDLCAMAGSTRLAARITSSGQPVLPIKRCIDGATKPGFFCQN